jgi:Holliday junction resolvasome RuvABC ATP-dependent DNA helicase subunit
LAIFVRDFSQQNSQEITLAHIKDSLSLLDINENDLEEMDKGTTQGTKITELR